MVQDTENTNLPDLGIAVVKKFDELGGMSVQSRALC